LEFCTPKSFIQKTGYIGFSVLIGCFSGTSTKIILKTYASVGPSVREVSSWPFHHTDPGSFKLTDISYRLRFSFVSFECIVRLRFVHIIGSFVSCIVRQFN
jgi:hypothetical protein